MDVILVGFRGTGKTLVAEHLATRLGWSCFDSDAEIRRVAGQSIAEIFAREGEAGFRARETAVLAGLGPERGRVLSVGGGALVRPENRRLLAALGRVVWLTATAETIHRRLAADPRTAGERPDLTPAGGMQEIRQLLGQREPIYRECAELEVDTEDKAPAAVAEEIIERLKLVP